MRARAVTATTTSACSMAALTCASKRGKERGYGEVEKGGRGREGKEERVRGLRSPGATTHRRAVCSSGWHLAARIWGMNWGSFCAVSLSRMRVCTPSWAWGDNAMVQEQCNGRQRVREQRARTSEPQKPQPLASGGPRRPQRALLRPERGGRTAGRLGLGLEGQN